MNLCKCGCGKECKNLFVTGHNWKGIKRGVMSEDIKIKISNAKKGTTSPFKGKTHTDEAKQKNRLKHIGSHIHTEIHKESLRQWWKDNKLRLNKEPINKKYKIDQDFFKQIDNEVKAYWLGYIMADGTIIVNNSYKLGLVSIDKELLEKFKQDTKSTHPIYEYLNKVNNKTIYSMAINDKIFVNHLINQGVMPRKTYYLIFPNIIDNLLNHFIRGYWDGDGSVSFYSRKRLAISVVGTELFIKALALCLREKCGLKSSNYFNHSNNLYCFSRTQRQALKICNFLYNNATNFLQRKYDNYLKYKGVDHAI